jgi:hypothetical protein
MNRRQALMSVSAITAHVLFVDVVAAFARTSAALADESAPWQAELFGSDEAAILEDVVDTILPPTSSPGAKAARVHVFVDLAASRCLGSVEQQALSDALDELGETFGTLPADQRIARLSAMDKTVFATLKELTVLGYFSSEIGCTQALAYEAVPGGYKGCLDLKPGQKAWATR